MHFTYAYYGYNQVSGVNMQVYTYYLLQWKCGNTDTLPRRVTYSRNYLKEDLLTRHLATYKQLAHTFHV